MTKPECATASVGLFSFGHLDFVILSSFVIGQFVIDFYQWRASEHATAVKFEASWKKMTFGPG